MVCHDKKEMYPASFCNGFLLKIELIELLMNILIDTNIVIPLEDTSRLLDPSLAKLCRQSDSSGHVLFVHPAQKEDIERDKDEQRRNIVLSRLEQYQAIPSPPELSSEELLNNGWRQASDNDRIDNLLLHALCRGAVHFLVTNDKGIHRKARQAQCQEQVHYLDQFLVYLDSQTSEQPPPPFGINDKYLYEFGVNQIFFDSLREGYSEFDRWYMKSAQSQRKAWCISNENEIQAICIYKREVNPLIVDNGKPLDGEALKLCTFKIGREVRGRKLGERFLYTAFKYANENKIRYVYLHTFGAEQEMLVSLCEDFGFKFAGTYAGRDQVYVKDMTEPHSIHSDLAPLNYAIDFYPNFLDGEEIDKFIVPIKPEYHNDLFADISDTAEGLFANDPSMYSPQSNTIKKAYICHANTKMIKSGSLLLFYRTHDRMSIECIGIVEQTYRGKDLDKVLPLVSKRTVYSRSEVETFLEKETLVILFRLMITFPPVCLEYLKSVGLNGSFQSIRKITHEQYAVCIGEKE
jgi:hypothetical protein